MQIIKARVMNRIGTEAEWLANNPIILNGEICLIKIGDLIKFKIGDGIKTFSQLTYNVFDPTNLRGQATPATDPGDPISPELWVGETGIYPNFGNIEITSPAGFIVWDGDNWSVVQFNIDLSSYVKNLDLAVYLKDKNILNYTVDEQKVIKAIKSLDLHLPEDQLNDIWLIQLVGTNILDAGLNPFYQNAVQIRNETKNANYALVNFKNSDPAFNINDNAGVGIYEGVAFQEGQHLGIGFKLVINWKELPDDFLNISSTLILNNGFTTKKEIDILPNYVKNSKRAFVVRELQILRALKNLEVRVATSDVNDVWAINVVTTIPYSGSLPTFHNFSIEIKNITKSEFYNIINLGSGYDKTENNGILSQRGRKTKGQAKFIEYSFLIDYKLLPDIFEFAQDSILINVGVNSYQNQTTLIKYPNSRLRNKYILWLGTSIPESGLYPTYIAQQHGAKIINNSLGSSPVRFGRKDTGSYDGLNWESYTLSLSATQSEKENIISNWATIRATLTGDPPVTLTTEQENKIRNSSFDVLLMPYLAGVYPMPDLFVFDHLFNDRYYELGFETEEEYYTVPVTNDNRTYPLGALNFLINKIYEVNPRAEILLFGHYENQRDPQVSIAQQNISKFRALQLYRQWEHMSMGQFKVPNTQQYWDVVPWVYYNNLYPDESRLEDMNAIRFKNPDGVHYGTDETGLTQIEAGDKGSSYFNTIF